MARHRERILVTGANGFIGRHLVNMLAEDGQRIIFGVDREFHPKFPTKDNVVKVSCNLASLNEVMKLPSVDIIYHLAAINGTKRFYEEPWTVFWNSSLPSFHLIERYSKHGDLNRFVYTSSSEVYADSYQSKEVSKTDEQIAVGFSNILNPRWSYGGAKLAGEIALNAASLERNLPFSIVRYHNVYGRDMGFNHVIPDFIERGKKGNFLLNGGDNIRSFIHVSDAVDATIQIASSPRGKDKIVHVGTESPISMIELAQIIMTEAGWIGDLQILESPPGSTSYRCPDTSFLRDTIGFHPKVNIKDGIRDILVAEGVIKSDVR
jgi:UDP-glucose 4-epimerase